MLHRAPTAELLCFEEAELLPSKSHRVSGGDSQKEIWMLERWAHGNDLHEWWWITGK